MIKKIDYINFIDGFFENDIVSKSRVIEWSSNCLYEQYELIIDKIYDKIEFCDNPQQSHEQKLDKIITINKKIQFDKYYELLFFYSNIRDTRLYINSDKQNDIDSKIRRLKARLYHSTGLSDESIKKLLSNEEKNSPEQLKKKDGRKYRFIIAVVMPTEFKQNNISSEELYEINDELVLDGNIDKCEYLMNQCNDKYNDFPEIKLHKFAHTHFEFYTGLLERTSINMVELIDKAIKSTYQMIRYYEENNDSLSFDDICEIFTFVVMNDVELQNVSNIYFRKENKYE